MLRYRINFLPIVKDEVFKPKETEKGKGNFFNKAKFSLSFYFFLTKKHLTPKSHQTKGNPHLPGANRQKLILEKLLLKNSINNYYKKLSNLTLKAYNIHRFLGKETSGEKEKP